jgi:hypothetical protein
MLTDIISSFTEINNLAGFITLAITILGAISLFIANMGRYFQAKKFGVPIRAVFQANISDSADLWVALVGTLGFGVFVPITMLGSDINRWALFGVMAASFALGLFSTKSSMRIGYERKVKRGTGEYIVNHDMTVPVLALGALVTAIAYMRLHTVYDYVFIAETGAPGGFFQIFRTIAAAVVLCINVLLMFLFLFVNVHRRLFGSGDVMTTSIDGQNYIIALRHNQYQWILMPCNIEEYEKKRKRYTTDVKRVLFDRGVFIMKDLTALKEPIIYRANFSVVQRGSRKHGPLTQPNQSETP